MTQGRSRYVNVYEAAHELRTVDAHGTPNLAATRKLLERVGVKVYRCGRSLRWLREDVEALTVEVLQTPRASNSVTGTPRPKVRAERSAQPVTERPVEVNA